MTLIAIKISYKIKYLFIILALIISVAPISTYAWELEKEDDGIRVYTKVVEGSGFKSYRAVTKVRAPIPGLVSLVKDIKGYPTWIDTCVKGVLLKEINRNQLIAYTLNNAPWPVSDRDAVVLNTTTRNKSQGPVTIHIEGKPSYIPEKPGIVRVKKIKGYWKFIQYGKEIAQVIYEVHSEPGGNIPSWLINQIVVTQPFNTLKNMKKMMNRKKIVVSDQNLKPVKNINHLSIE
jgi:ribosome-associated toxin RatA of RatAB toxin-antitoxin module